MIMKKKGVAVELVDEPAPTPQQQPMGMMQPNMM
jgi:hypothetical protein